jgi:hypothetical protein
LDGRSELILRSNLLGHSTSFVLKLFRRIRPSSIFYSRLSMREVDCQNVLRSRCYLNGNTGLRGSRFNGPVIRNLFAADRVNWR